MAKLTFEELLEEYKTCVIATYDIDYADKSSVKRSNEAVAKMIKISKYLGEEYPSRIYDFAELLDNTDFRIDIWAAHHILENMNYPSELESKALDIIIKYSKEDSAEGLGNRMWLENWYKEKNSIQ